LCWTCFLFPIWSQETPIDSIDPYLFFSDSLSSLQATIPSRHTGLMASVTDAASVSAMQGILVLAAQEKALRAKRAADEASWKWMGYVMQ